MCKLQIIFLLYIVNRLRLKMYFEIKWSKLKIKQYHISSNRLSRDIWTSQKHFSGHQDAKSKTGDNPGFPRRTATVRHSENCGVGQ
jgi:hypothetical protein